MSSTSASASHTPSSGKEKKLSDKDLDLMNAHRGVWLVKVPKYIADRWEKVADQTEVGKLRITRRPGIKPTVAFSLDDTIVAAREPEAVKETSADKKGAAKNGSSSNGAASTSGNNGPKPFATNKQIPKEHKFVVNTVSAQTLAVFSLTSTDSIMPGPEHRLALEGRVVQRAECRPISDSVYMQLKKESIIKASEPVRQTKRLDKAVVAYKPKSNHVSNIVFAAKKKEEGKMLRENKDIVMEKLFSLFERHQYYNIKDLVKETRQPVTYLKEILKEICHYNLKNPHKNMWELKPEYRHYKEEEKPVEDRQDSDSDDD